MRKFKIQSFPVDHRELTVLNRILIRDYLI